METDAYRQKEITNGEIVNKKMVTKDQESEHICPKWGVKNIRSALR